MSARVCGLDTLERESLKDAGHVDLQLTGGEDRLVKQASLDKERDRVLGGKNICVRRGGRRKGNQQEAR